MDPFVGEIRMCAFAFAPQGWALCQGQILQVMQNQALFSLLGNKYGGDGRTTFALPDLRGRTPLHTDFSANQIGTAAGLESVTLNSAQMPAHTHLLEASTSKATMANVGANGDRLLAASYINNPTTPSQDGPGKPIYGVAGSPTPMGGDMCSSTGGGQAHNNMQPSLVVNYIIALSGLYPPHSS